MMSRRLAEWQQKSIVTPVALRQVASPLVSAWRAGLRLNSIATARIGLLGYSFLVCVCLPAVCYFLYLVVLAAPEYEAEARFAVRGPSETRSSAITEALSSLSSMVGGKSSAQDSFIVADYIRSRTIIENLGGKEAVEGIYSVADADWFSRLPSGQSLEDVWNYWLRKVTAAIDTQSNVLTLRVRAFTPEDAKGLADRILERSELLVNEISERARRDALSRAQAEVDLSLQRLAKLRASLLEFRTGAQTIDPLGSANSLGETLTTLHREKIALEGNRQALKSVMDKNAPTLRVISSQIESVDQQIKNLQDKMTSQTEASTSLSGQLAVYEDLQLQSQFAEKLFTISQAAFEKARAEQDKQQLYLVTIVRPTTPEEAAYPRPFMGAAVVFAVCLMCWSMLALVGASVGDHVG